MKNIKSIEFYNKYALFYSKYSKVKKVYLNSVDNLIIHNVKDKLSMLDIGSANGIRAMKLAEKLKIKDLTLIDNSPQMHKLYLSKFNDSYLADISKENIFIKRKYDVITCLWNVLGHIDDEKSVRVALNNIKILLNNNGLIFIDVNNRYNYKNYGLRNVSRNIIKDIFRYSWRNGNFSLKVKYGKNEIKGNVHIFNPIEFILLLKSVGIRINKLYFIDYNKGLVSKNPFKGQMFFVLQK